MRRIAVVIFTLIVAMFDPKLAFSGQEGWATVQTDYLTHANAAVGCVYHGRTYPPFSGVACVGGFTAKCIIGNFGTPTRYEWLVMHELPCTEPQRPTSPRTP